MIYRSPAILGLDFHLITAINITRSNVWDAINYHHARSAFPYRAKHPTRPMIFDASAVNVISRRKQSRGNSLVGKSFDAHSIKIDLDIFTSVEG